VDRQRVYGPFTPACPLRRIAKVRLGSKREAILFGLMSALASCGHSAAWRKLHRKPMDEGRRADDAEAPRNTLLPDVTPNQNAPHFSAKTD
jgi:hypothetical protein